MTLKKKLEAVINGKHQSILMLSGSDNPTVIGLRKAAQAQKEAFQAVLDALNGDSALLDVYLDRAI